MKKRFSIGEFAKITNMTARTLHHYDEIGILIAKRTEAGHRYYETNDFFTLQKIISYKFLGYSLEEIKKFLTGKQPSMLQSLQRQHEEMIKKREHINKVIRALDHAMLMVKSEGELDESIFITLINSIQMEDEHRDWISKNLPEQFSLITSSFPEEKIVEIEKQFIEVTMNLKKLLFTDPNSVEVTEVLDRLFALVTDLLGEDLSMLASIEQETFQNDDWLFPFPFSKDDEKWLSEAIELYMQRKGLNGHDGNKR